MQKHTTPEDPSDQELPQTPEGRTGDSVRWTGPPPRRLDGYAPAESLPLSRHYHTAEIPGDLNLMPCSDIHEQKHDHDGRSIDACELKSWGFAYWRRGATPRSPSFRLSEVDGGVTCFRCKSWRHRGECRDFVFRRDFKRIIDALESRPAWLFSVLTLNPDRWRGGAKSGYKNFWRCWQRLRQQLNRVVGQKIEYIAVMEQHRSGWPHMNLVLYWKGMENVEDLEAYAVAIERVMKDRAPSCGLGYSVYCEALQGRKQIAGYFSGQALGRRGNGPVREDVGADLRRVTGEISKQTKEYQIPTDAPFGFRRIRSSRGLMAPVTTGSEYTGGIHRGSFRCSPGGAGGGPGESSEAGARSELHAGRRELSGVRGRAPAELDEVVAVADRPRAHRAARPRIEHLTVIGAVRKTWWSIASQLRRSMEAIGVPDPTIRAELKALQPTYVEYRKRF